MSVETVESFASRVFTATGLSLAQLPDLPEEALMWGSIVAGRGHTAVVLHDPHPGGGLDGGAEYRRAGVVARTPDLPPADPSATGEIVPDEEVAS